MSLRIAVYTTRSGQTSTYWATSLAWTLAAKYRVMLIDLDMEGGTTADLLHLRTDERSIGSVFGDRAVTSAELENQAVVVPQQPNLRVVPGLRATGGPEISDALKKITPSLEGLPDQVVIADLGSPLSHPLLRSPRGAAEEICSAFHRVFIVIRDDPALVVRSILVLRAARPPFGEIVLCQQRGRALRREIIESLERELPDLPIRDVWSYDENRAMRMGDSGIPLSMTGIERDLGLEQMSYYQALGKQR